MKELLKEYLDTYLKTGVLNNELRKKILDEATAWNKKEVFKDFINSVIQFTLYTDMDESLTSDNFGLDKYVEQFKE